MSYDSLRRSQKKRAQFDKKYGALIGGVLALLFLGYFVVGFYLRYREIAEHEERLYLGSLQYYTALSSEPVARQFVDSAHPLIYDRQASQTLSLRRSSVSSFNDGLYTSEMMFAWEQFRREHERRTGERLRGTPMKMFYGPDNALRSARTLR